jgi:hypothetical protein
VTDLGTLAVTTGYNRLRYWRLLKDIGSQGTKETRDWMALARHDRRERAAS